MVEAAVLSARAVLGKALANELVKQVLSQSSKVGFSNIEARMNNVNRELRLMQEFIDRTDIQDQSNEHQVTWIIEVRKVANDIEDTIDEFVYLVGTRKIVGKLFWVELCFKDPKSLIALKRVASQLLKAERSIKHLAEGRNRWVSTTNNTSISDIPGLSKESSHIIVADSAHFIAEDNIVGVEEIRVELTNRLNSNEHRLSIISVWGMGGVGKTTLVANVFKREKQHFDSNAWITISQNYTIENILRSLISEIHKNVKNDQIDTTKMNIRELIEYVCNHLTDKKYLIVLDDMWNPIAFQDIRNAFIDNHQGSRIMITSRILQVAFLAPECNRLELKPLQKNESWDLFCKKAFPFERNNECPSHLKEWTRHIIEKCNGLPLALVSLGSLLSLHEQTESEWQQVHDQLTSLLQNNPNLDHVKKILNLSFSYLPRHLKNCLLYCSLFLEDSLLARKKLIRLWVAEGFVEQKGKSTLEEVAEGYLKELVHRSMLQVVGRNDFGRVKRCRMHDIQRELIISLCEKENFGLVHEDNNSANADRFARRLSIAKLSEEKRQNVCLPKLRTFLCFDPTVPSSPWLSLIFKTSRCLSVLDLEGLPIETIPNNIGDLFNLHYLGLRKTMVKVLPKSIKKLNNLQTLDLYLSQIQKLPDGIIELKKLRHLFAQVNIDPTCRSLQYFSGINLPKEIFYLKEIQTIQAVESTDMVVRELRNLTQLRSFRILNVKEEHSKKLCESLSKMSLLSFLSINAGHETEIVHLDGLHLPNIQMLGISGRVRDGMLNSLLFQTSGERIQRLWLEWSQLQNDPLTSLSHLRNIASLYLNRAYEGQKLIFQEGWFSKLKRLVLEQMPNLTNVEMEQGTLERLEKIELEKLEQLAEIPKGIEHLSSLKWMVCTDMPADFGGLAKGRHALFHFTCVIQYLS